MVKGRGYDSFTVKEAKKDHIAEKSTTANNNDESTEDEDTEGIPFVTHIINNMHSVFYDVEVYIKKQQIYYGKGLHAHNSCISNNFQGAIAE